MSTVKTSNLQNASATNPNIVLNSDGTIGGDCLTQTCRAWVNFNGTGTVAIRASYNVSSITDHGVGDYTVTFTTAFADANYAVTALAGTTVGTGGLAWQNTSRANPATGSIAIGTVSFTISYTDPAYVFVAVFR